MNEYERALLLAVAYVVLDMLKDKADGVDWNAHRLEVETRLTQVLAAGSGH